MIQGHREIIRNNVRLEYTHSHHHIAIKKEANSFYTCVCIKVEQREPCYNIIPLSLTGISRYRK